MSNASPRDYTTTDVRVTTADLAAVTTKAHYKTKITTHRTTASRSGHATVAYYISGATPGYRVKVDVTLTSDGRTGSCATSFTPGS